MLARWGVDTRIRTTLVTRLGVFDEVSSAAFDANLQGFHGPVVFLDVDGVLNNTVLPTPGAASQ